MPDRKPAQSRRKSAKKPTKPTVSSTADAVALFLAERPGSADSPLGQIALRLAGDVDSGVPDGVRSAASRELRQVLREVADSMAAGSSDDVDELRAKRERRAG